MELLNLATANTDIKVYHCIFNSSHTMPYKTLAMHLTKCPDRPANYKNCNYNTLHVVPASELKNHEENCPDRYLIDQEFYESSDFIRPIAKIIKNPTLNANNKDDDELWDDAIPVATTSVIQNIKKRPNLMKPIQGLTKNQRKKYRSEINAKYCDVDLSYNKNTDVQTRTDLNNDLKDDQKNKEKQLFFGKKPNL